MKKQFTFLVAFLAAFSVQGASINWNLSGVATRVLNDYQGNVAANQIVYLTLGDASSLASITEADSKESFAAALAAITLDTTTTTATGTRQTVSNKPVESNLLTAGTRYAFALVYASEDADGTGYFKYITANATAYTTGDTQNSQSVSTSFANLTTASNWTKGYTAAAVPEPSTAVLALAGLALLLKRRKA